jgi:AcrR family transcriptional regulator
MTTRQSEILKEAIKLIAEKGIQGLTIKNLAKSINVTEPAIYRHFENKQQILVGLLSFFSVNKENFLSNVANDKISPIIKLKSIFESRFKYFSKNPAIASVIFSEELFRNDRLLSDRVFEIMNSSQKIMLEIIKKGQNLNTIIDSVPAEQLAFIITGALRLIVTKWRLSNYSFNLEDEGLILWNSIEQIIKK